MSEYLKSLLDRSTELKGGKSCKVLKQEICHMKEFVQLLDSIEERADNKAMLESQMFLENSDLECICHLSMKNTVSQNDRKY
jgi:hypothetical protein